MQIECPSCHLAGKVNELELPPLGRQFTCPRCKSSFLVAKPAAAGNLATMNSCPSCHYATFTEEVFAVCPKCGMTAQDYQTLTQKQREKEQAQRNQEALQRSFRNPDLVQVATAEPGPEPVRSAPEIEVAAWLCLAFGCALLCYGCVGLANYYSKDWQAVLSEPVLVPVSKWYVFFSLGLIPWLTTLCSLFFVWAAYRFLRLRDDALERLRAGAWAGVAVVVMYEAVALVSWIGASSSTPTFSYYAVGILSSLFMIALLGAPFFVLIWYLERDAIIRAFNKARVLSAVGARLGNEKK
jgi:predicted Zn finger-like uncharacterized protein